MNLNNLIVHFKRSRRINVEECSINFQTRLYLEQLHLLKLEPRTFRAALADDNQVSEKSVEKGEGTVRNLLQQHRLK